eukprot:TRINITY_DN1356_c0_g1_i1.p1 TRINITY_DN1356_c0_g1~~TRINITY_DN1356_c0_g1_i1.p1  ORF type:complete len:433 (+),score=119.53 TRINITY_DN1356_c0_g1_i1:1453-2751(+)
MIPFSSEASIRLLVTRCLGCSRRKTLKVISGAINIQPGGSLLCNGGINITALVPISITIGDGGILNLREVNVQTPLLSVNGLGRVNLLGASINLLNGNNVSILTAIDIGVSTLISTTGSATLILGGLVNVVSDCVLNGNVLFGAGSLISGVGQLVLGGDGSSCGFNGLDLGIAIHIPLVLKNNCSCNSGVLTILDGASLEVQAALIVHASASLVVQASASLILSVNAALVAVGDVGAQVDVSILGGLLIGRHCDLVALPGVALNIDGDVDVQVLGAELDLNIEGHVVINGVLSVLNGAVLVIDASVGAALECAQLNLDVGVRVILQVVAGECGLLKVLGEIDIAADLIINVDGLLGDECNVCEYGSRTGTFRSLQIFENGEDVSDEHEVAYDNQRAYIRAKAKSDGETTHESGSVEFFGSFSLLMALAAAFL